MCRSLVVLNTALPLGKPHTLKNIDEKPIVVKKITIPYCCSHFMLLTAENLVSHSIWYIWTVPCPLAHLSAARRKTKYRPILHFILFIKCVNLTNTYTFLLLLHCSKIYDSVYIYIYNNTVFEIRLTFPAMLYKITCLGTSG